MHRGRAKRVSRLGQDRTSCSLRLLPQHLRDLAHNGDCNFSRRHRVDIKPDRRVNAGDISIGEACLLQPLDPLGMSFP